jgi:Tat protein secretion system quality control protein TatD with DNase activity
LSLVLQTASTLRQEPPEEIAAVTSRNAERLFGLCTE